MADEQYTWLNRRTAERLLRGESLEAVDPSVRDQAERLAGALGALSAQAAAATGELPREQAVLAAFREARDAEAERTVAARPEGAPGRSVPAADADRVRIWAPARTGIRGRRPRWVRPARFALAAVVAAATLGGVALATGTGMLPTPFGDGQPRPAAPVSRPLASPSPQTSPGGPATGRGNASGQATGPDGGTGNSAPPASGTPSAPGSRWSGVAAACRDLRDGEELGAGRRHALENLAGGSAHVPRYCKGVLAADDSVSGSGESAGGKDNDGQGQGQGQGRGKAEGKGRSKGGQNGSAQGGDDESHPARGHGKGVATAGAEAAAPPPNPPPSSRKATAGPAGRP